MTVPFIPRSEKRKKNMPRGIPKAKTVQLTPKQLKERAGNGPIKGRAGNGRMMSGKVDGESLASKLKKEETEYQTLINVRVLGLLDRIATRLGTDQPIQRVDGGVMGGEEDCREADRPIKDLDPAPRNKIYNQPMADHLKASTASARPTNYVESLHHTLNAELNELQEVVSHLFDRLGGILQVEEKGSDTCAARVRDSMDGACDFALSTMSKIDQVSMIRARLLNLFSRIQL
jgi:hypothetical protein